MFLPPNSYIPDINPEGYYAIINGNTAVFPFTIGPNQLFDINTIQVAMTQDFSLRCWVSLRPVDISVTLNYPNTAYWHPVRSSNHHVVVYDNALPTPNYQSIIGVTPGNYFLNIQNLENRVNGFYVTITEIT